MIVPSESRIEVPERMTTTTRTRVMRALAVGPAAIVLLAACASPKATPSAAPPSAVTTPAASAAASVAASQAAASQPAASQAAGSQPAASQAAASAPASAAVGSVTLATATGPLGTYLTGRNGLTLYFFAKDTSGDATACTDPECKGAWPPMTIPAAPAPAAPSGASGTVTSFIRSDDDQIQLAYDGHPLYYFAGDTKAGDTNGEGIGGLWYVADVAGTLPSAAPASAGASPAASASKSGGYNY
jgi:predicted lipoprotein with Yx(FWY)xxD motif